MEWFKNLQDGLFTTSDDLKEKFLDIFQPTNDSYQLFVNLFQIQMKEDEYIRDFIDRFNQTIGKIHLTHQPSESNQVCFFIATMDVEVNLWLQRLGMKNLANVQKEAIKLDDALILSGVKSIKTYPTKEYLCG